LTAQFWVLKLTIINLKSWDQH